MPYHCADSLSEYTWNELVVQGSMAYAELRLPTLSEYLT
jgi:hypothetical protein